MTAGEPGPLLPDRRRVLIGGAMLATAAGAALLVPRAAHPPLRPGALEAAIPRTLGAWNFQTVSGLVLPPQDEIEERTYDQVLTRVYADDAGPPVMLLIAYGGGQSGMFVIHRPEACYPAQGFRLEGEEKVTVPIAPGREVTGTFWSASNNVRTEQLLYWTRIGADFPETWAAEQVALVGNNLRLTLPDGVLVRMSVLSADPAPSLARLDAFTKALVAGVGPLGRRILLGS